MSKRWKYILRGLARISASSTQARELLVASREMPLALWGQIWKLATFQVTKEGSAQIQLRYHEFGLVLANVQQGLQVNRENGHGVILGVRDILQDSLNYQNCAHLTCPFPFWIQESIHSYMRYSRSTLKPILPTLNVKAINKAAAKGLTWSVWGKWKWNDLKLTATELQILMGSWWWMWWIWRPCLLLLALLMYVYHGFRISSGIVLTWF